MQGKLADGKEKNLNFDPSFRVYEITNCKSDAVV